MQDYSQLERFGVHYCHPTPLDFSLTVDGMNQDVGVEWVPPGDQRLGDSERYGDVLWMIWAKKDGKHTMELNNEFSLLRSKRVKLNYVIAKYSEVTLKTTDAEGEYNIPAGESIAIPFGLMKNELLTFHATMINVKTGFTAGRLTTTPTLYFDVRKPDGRSTPMYDASSKTSIKGPVSPFSASIGGLWGDTKDKSLIFRATKTGKYQIVVSGRSPYSKVLRSAAILKDTRIRLTVTHHGLRPGLTSILE